MIKDETCKLIEVGTAHAIPILLCGIDIAGTCSLRVSQSLAGAGS